MAASKGGKGSCGTGSMKGSGMKSGGGKSGTGMPMKPNGGMKKGGK